ncbi:hypothetical protein E3O11_15030 [Cryobacterium levicorallinum]|uniref:Thiosulfate reductase cytochrome b subunit n=1 Tax=Cryobacterium levicorallinum TaxID=995038 RepID=A0A1I3E5J8_9MICO|nr:cytochrome b/b6 domain-containing protein [Cryobacterium levicorallinum]TFB82423.1 hypothetical protein E3O11_15030 [Cryobacterium levicorallinum]GEP28570.1 hypothetical protein CLE01_31680 [Cryobacterium levicorallinum]SFH94133.1 Thiosulfate reductase cytochrome b subunit [Cryobacterium levicorallinum]
MTRPSKTLIRLLWAIPLALAILLALVLAARALRETAAGQNFLAAYPGTATLPETAPVGIPAWLAWQHGLNVFFLLFIVRSGWQVRTSTRPAAYWQRNNTGRIRTKRAPTRISLNLWAHLTSDTLWVINGVVFYVLLFVTGQWVRIVPLDYEIIPNALSAALQYLSLNWPVEDGWVNYNALQTLSYFAVVFIAAPLALITGLRMSPAGISSRFSKLVPITVARAIHFPVMIFFVAFTAVHVTLVLATGALRNLNHMYAARSDDSWVGFWIFAASLVLMIIVWVVSRPLVLRSIASLTGSVSR